MFGRRQVSKPLESAAAKFVDWQDGGRWADSHTVGLFSPAEKAHRSCQTIWDVHWATGGGSGVRDWQLLLSERGSCCTGFRDLSVRRGAG